MNDNEITVSVCCLSYNHENFVASCLSSILQQECDFNFEILVYDDASTDASAKIIRDYAKKFPSVVKPVYQLENQHSKGVWVNAKFNLSRVSGRYVAFCECDDYWTDRTRLQRQVDYLEKNEHIDAIGGLTKEINEEGTLGQEFPRVQKTEQDVFFVTDSEILRMEKFIHLSSLVMRSQVLHHLEFFNGQRPSSGDLFWLVISVLGAGFLPVLNSHVSNYRIHNGGAWSSTAINSRYYSYITMWTSIKKFLEDKEHNRLAEICALNIDYFSFRVYGIRYIFSGPLLITSKLVNIAIAILSRVRRVQS